MEEADEEELSARQQFLTRRVGSMKQGTKLGSQPSAALAFLFKLLKFEL